MDVKTVNTFLSQGEVDREDMWPRIVEMESKACQFRFEFGLEKLPTDPGLIVIRGPRQYGKSTWLDINLRRSVQDFGKGSAYYLNGDELADAEALASQMHSLYTAYHPDAKIRRLFIDEITAVPQWEKAVKRLIDQGLFRDVLIITTGSKASDLRHGSEKLPGRKGKLKKNEYLFLPVSYREFYLYAGKESGEEAWKSYLIAGGSPVALNDILQFEKIPDYFVQLTRDWVLGEIVSSGRSRLALSQLLAVLMRYGGNPVGFAKLARESGMANNTVAAGYVEQLSDLLTLLPSWPWDPQHDFFQLRKPCKFHFINLAAAVCFHSSSMRHPHEFDRLDPDTQSMMIEWLVAQEIWRRGVLEEVDNPEAIGFWASKEHEIDFVTPQRKLIEVKKGKAGPLDFTWFEKTFPKKKLTVICKTPFQTRSITGITIHDFLLRAPTSLHYEQEE